MPLVIQYNGPYAAPKIVCDHCGQVIDDAEDGNYQWQNDSGTEALLIFFTHKACCARFEKARGGDWSAMGLECLPYYLSRNLHLSWRTAQASAQLMSR